MDALCGFVPEPCAIIEANEIVICHDVFRVDLKDFIGRRANQIDIFESDGILQ